MAVACALLAAGCAAPLAAPHVTPPAIPTPVIRQFDAPEPTPTAPTLPPTSATPTAPAPAESSPVAAGPLPTVSSRSTDPQLASLILPGELTLRLQAPITDPRQLQQLVDALTQTPGIVSASSDGAQVTIQYDPDLIDPARLAARLATLGHPATP